MRINAGTSRRTTAAFCALVVGAAIGAAACTPEEIAAVQAWGRNCHRTHSCVTTTTQPATTTTAKPTTTTAATTTTAVATTTTAAPTTTTTTQPGGRPAFLSYPHQTGRQSFSGSNVEVSARSYVGFTSGACLTVSNATNVWVHDVDFDGCGGAVFLINVTGTVTVERVRARNTGNGSIGSGQGNVVQFNNVHSCAATIRSVDGYGGDTEDMLSIFRSGGCDSTHPLDVSGNHLESPLSGPLAWTSSSGTCINAADAGGGNIRIHDNTLLNCAAVGIQMNEPNPNVVVDRNVVYGAARTTSNVGLSQWAGSSCSCGTDVGNRYTANRVFWVKASGSASASWLSHTYPVTIDGQSASNDASTPQVHVTL